MNTETYRDELDSLASTIRDFKACVNYGERALASGRIERWWRRVALSGQPKRLPQRDKDRCDRLLSEAADIINRWLVETAVGPPEHEDRPQPSAKAMADTMKFCNAAKRRGFA